MVRCTRAPLTIRRLVCLTTVAIAGAAGLDGLANYVVQSPCGAWRGSRSGDGVWAFRGIPYAEPPTGHRRFQPPVPKACDGGSGDADVVDASQCGDVCVQKNFIAGFKPMLQGTALVLCALAACFALCSVCLSDASPCRKRLSKVEANQQPLIGAGPPPRGSCCRGCCRVTSTMLAAAFLVGAGAALVTTWVKAQSFAEVIGSEDCLTLNVFAPEQSIAEKQRLPVMVFIHGGDLIMGTGCDYSTSSGGVAFGYGSEASLPRTSRVISVSLNYRLSVFGFLHIENTQGEAIISNSTNAGLLDVIEALRWTRANIAFFGGDPDRVTIYGQSSGGTMVVGLLASPMAKGLFHRAYSASGSASIWANKSEASDEWRRFLVPNLHCAEAGNDPGLARCLQDSPAYQLFSAQVAEAIDPPWIFSLPTDLETGVAIHLPIADGKVIVGNISAVVAKGDSRLASVPTLITATREETDAAWAPNTAWPLTRENVITYSQQMFGDDAFGKRAWSLFEPSAAYPARQRWDMLASQIRVVCPNLLFAKQVSSAPGRSTVAPVYAALVTYKPENKFRSFFGIPITSVAMKYAFHTWDIPFLLFNQSKTASFGPALVYTFSRTDQAVADRYRAAILEFAEEGRISGWSAVTGSPSEIELCEIGETTVCTDKSPALEQCRFLQYYGLSPRMAWPK